MTINPRISCTVVPCTVVQCFHDALSRPKDVQPSTSRKFETDFYRFYHAVNKFPSVKFHLPSLNPNLTLPTFAIVPLSQTQICFNFKHADNYYVNCVNF